MEVFSKILEALSKEKLGSPIYYFLLGMIALNLSFVTYWAVRFVGDINKPPKRTDTVGQVKKD